MATKFITVSIEIMHDKNLTPNQKFILAEIQQLSSLEKGCYATNKHFSELIGITTMGVSKAIHDLEKKGYITIDNSQTKRNFGRIITINSSNFTINCGKSTINSSLESKENKTDNKTIEVNPLTLGEFTKYDFQLKRQVSFDKLTKEYLSKLEEEINDHNEKLYFKRLQVNSPLSELLSFREFSIKFLSNGRKQTNFWTKFLEYEKYTFENEAKRKGL